MTLSVLKKIINGVPNDEFGEYTMVRDPETTIIRGIRIDDKLKVIYI